MATPTPTTNFDTSLYIDMAYSGNSYSSYYSQTNTVVIKGTLALKNVMKMYLMSQLGDYGRNVSKGGPMIKIIGKPLSDSYGTTIEETIKKSLSIYSNVIVTSCTAIPDRNNRRWNISVSFIDTGNKVQDSFSIGVPASTLPA